ncbi:hypothetical protein HYS31_08370 [Candidatus Woesearchaeota archaeon]|nr:hypothetical protein [Candidatus Woesearchaeota archaeon]
MPDTQIISEAPINLHILKKELEAIKKSGKELNFRSGRTEDFLNQVMPHKNADELYDKIAKLNIPRLKEQHIHKIIDIVPATAEELKIVLQGYTLTLSNESVKKIVDTINDFLAKYL